MRNTTMGKRRALLERRSGRRTAAPPEAVALALCHAVSRLTIAARRGDAPATHEAAGAVADLAQIHALPKVRWQARALLGWRDDERSSEQRLEALLLGLDFAVVAAVDDLTARLSVH